MRGTAGTRGNFESVRHVCDLECGDGPTGMCMCPTAHFKHGSLSCVDFTSTNLKTKNNILIYMNHLHYKVQYTENK